MLFVYPEIEINKKEVLGGGGLGDGDTPLMLAVTLNRVKCVAALLADPRVDLNTRPSRHKKCGSKMWDPEEKEKLKRLNTQLYPECNRVNSLSSKDNRQILTYCSGL